MKNLIENISVLGIEILIEHNDESGNLSIFDQGVKSVFISEQPQKYITASILNSDGTTYAMGKRRDNQEAIYDLFNVIYTGRSFLNCGQN